MTSVTRAAPRSSTEFRGWRKSSYSNPNNQCVEVATRTDAVAVRDSKNPATAVLAVTPPAWTAFLASTTR